MKVKVDDRVLELLSDARPHDEWEMAQRLWSWDDSNRAKHGAWMRVLVQALWRLYNNGKVGYFWVSHGEGVPGDRLWLRSSE